MRNVTAGKNCWKTAAAGTLIMLLLSGVIAAAAGACIAGGIIPADKLELTVVGMTLLISLLGAVFCCHHTVRFRLPTCLAASFLYLIMVLVLQKLCYQQTTVIWHIPLACISGAVIGAALSNIRIRR